MARSPARPSWTAALVLLTVAGCAPPSGLEIVYPRRGTVIGHDELVVVWRLTDRDSLETGDHFHVFLDRDLPAVGDAIPTDDPNIVHIRGDTTYAFTGLEPGPHRVTVVLGDAAHRARGGFYRASVPFRVQYDP